MTYVAVLMVISLLFTLGLSFAHRMGTQTAIIESRFDGMQARYLAETAANHAMWRLLYENVKTIEIPIDQSEGDVEQKDSGKVELDKIHVEMGGNPYVGLMFRIVAVPPSATITHATVTFVSKHNHSEPTDLKFWGENRHQPAPFMAIGNDLSSRTKTAASVSWLDIPAWEADQVYQSPDLTPLVQEIVNRPGWRSGSDIAILVESLDLGGKRCLNTWDEDPQLAAKLSVTFRTTGSGEGAFPRSEDVYYMHTFAGGKYGYRVRRHTETTFATIASLGAYGDVVARQSHVLYVPPPLTPTGTLLAYETKGSPELRYRELANAAWGSEKEVLDPADQIQWLKIAAAPSQVEQVLATLEQSGKDTALVRLSVWDGENWGNGWSFSTGSSNADSRPFDIAYESLSGHALLLNRADSGDGPFYSLWNGETWVQEQSVDLDDSEIEDIGHIEMISNPMNDEILVGITYGVGDLVVLLWEGEELRNEPLIDLEDFASKPDSYAMAYEQISGDALILHSYSGGSLLGSRTWDGESLGPVRQITIGNPRGVRLVADPTSDSMFAAVLDSEDDLHTLMWDGDSWTAPYRVETSVGHRDHKPFDVGWESSGGEALAFWTRSSSSRLQYSRWTRGEAAPVLYWGQARFEGPSMDDELPWIRALSLHSSGSISVVAKNNGLELRSTLWDGNEFTDVVALTDVPGTRGNGYNFDFAAPDFAPDRPVFVDAGDDIEIGISSLPGNLEGRVHQDGVPALATSKWTQVSGPGSVNFDEPASPRTSFSVDQEGEYTLRLAADDGTGSVSDELKVSVNGGVLTYRDEFENESFSNTDGSVTWTGAWTEVGESDGPGSGDIAITDDAGSRRLRLRDNDNGGEGVQRSIDLSSAESVTLRFDYRRDGLDKSSDFVSLTISTQGESGPWVELDRFVGEATDDDYTTVSYDISNYATSNTLIRLRTSSSMGGSDTVWIDNVEIRLGNEFD